MSQGVDNNCFSIPLVIIPLIRRLKRLILSEGHLIPNSLTGGLVAREAAPSLWDIPCLLPGKLDLAGGPFIQEIKSRL